MQFLMAELTSALRSPEKLGGGGGGGGGPSESEGPVGRGLLGMGTTGPPLNDSDDTQERRM